MSFTETTLAAALRAAAGRTCSHSSLAYVALPHRLHRQIIARSPPRPRLRRRPRGRVTTSRRSSAAIFPVRRTLGGTTRLRGSRRGRRTGVDAVQSRVEHRLADGLTGAVGDEAAVGVAGVCVRVHRQARQLGHQVHRQARFAGRRCHRRAGAAGQGRGPPDGAGKLHPGHTRSRRLPSIHPRRIPAPATARPDSRLRHRPPPRRLTAQNAILRSRGSCPAGPRRRCARLQRQRGREEAPAQVPGPPRGWWFLSILS